MEADEKICPYCAELIKAEAVRCKHCQADLSAPAPAPAPAPAMEQEKSGMGFFSILLIIIVVLGVMFFGYGAMVGNSPEGKAKAQGRAAIEMCRDNERSYTGPAGAKSIITGACEKLENDFRTSFGHAP